MNTLREAAQNALAAYDAHQPLAVVMEELREATAQDPNYEFKIYKIGGAELEAGFYSTNELRDLVKSLDRMNAINERSMRKMK